MGAHAHGVHARERARVIVLVGFMGAGKTTIGRALAQRLGWRFLDFDEAIVERAGMDVATIFRTRGEPAFRELERQLTAELSSADAAVLAPGGGWVANSGAVERLPHSAVLVWLRVSPQEALRRLADSQIERPLLAGPDPLDAARGLIAAREPLYATAHLTIDTDGRAPETIVDLILEELDLKSDGT